MMRLDRFVARRHTFQPHVGDWRPERLGTEEWDTGESISRREGDDRLALLPRTWARGPGHLGSVFADVVYHNGASVRLLAGDRVEGIEMTDVRAAWSEAAARYVHGARELTSDEQAPVPQRAADVTDAVGGDPHPGAPSVA
jgi:nucleoid-associated protein YgaU